MLLFFSYPQDRVKSMFSLIRMHWSVTNPRPFGLRCLEHPLGSMPVHDLKDAFPAGFFSRSAPGDMMLHFFDQCQQA
jgi:hypothetical protein